MTLRRKLLIMYLAIGMIVLLLMGIWMFSAFKAKQLEAVQTNVNNQLALLDFSLTNFIDEVENNIVALSQNEIVRTRNDSDFTNFLDANEDTFEYHIGDVEQDIITILNTYRTTHPYVNSVYMGRENGSFMRSNPRNEPTQYDPRDRPWYILAKENPGKVMVTEPYQSLTTTDINVGIVTALTDLDRGSLRSGRGGCHPDQPDRIHLRFRCGPFWTIAVGKRTGCHPRQ